MGSWGCRYGCDYLEPHPELLAKSGLWDRENDSGATMSREEAIQSIEAGIEIVELELSRGVVSG